MSDHVSFKDLPEGGEKFEPAKASKLIGFFGLVGLLGAIGSAYFAFGAGAQQAAAFSYSWLFAIFFAFTFVCGGCFWMLLHNASNSGWGVAVRRLWENLGNLAPYLLVLALPLLISTKMQDQLWEWTTTHREAKAIGETPEHLAAAAAHAEAHHNTGEKKHGPESPTLHGLHEIAKKDPHAHLLVNKYGYLNLNFWSIRFVLYFVILSYIAYRLRKFFLDQEKDGEIKHTIKAREFSCRWMLFFALTLTFAAVDWLMALDYTWFSTMWGVYIFAGCAWASMALSIMLLNYLRSNGYMLKVTTEEHFHLMGKLLLAFTIFWAYIAFSQYFLIWYANIPEETRFYFVRNTDGWRWLSIFIVVGHFIAPFVLLLSQPRKKNPRFMAAMTAWILFMHLADIYWNVIPERGPSLYAQGVWAGEHGHGGSWIPGAWIGDVAALACVVGILGFIYLRSLGKNSLYAWRDPRLLESVNVHN
jgi:hypothetical protein